MKKISIMKSKRMMKDDERSRMKMMKIIKRTQMLKITVVTPGNLEELLTVFEI